MRMPKKIAVAFDAEEFLDSPGLDKRLVEFRRDQTVFAQGTAANSVMYILKGGVKLSVLSKRGKEAVIAMLGPGDFFGEGCLAGQEIRMGSATAVMPSAILRIDKGHMAQLLHK